MTDVRPSAPARADLACRWLVGPVLGTALLLCGSLDKLPAIGPFERPESRLMAAAWFYWSCCGRAAYHLALLRRNVYLHPEPTEMMALKALLMRAARSSPRILTWIPMIPPLVFCLLCSGLFCSRFNAIFLAYAVCAPIALVPELLAGAEGVLTMQWGGARLSLPEYMAVIAITLCNATMFMIFPLGLSSALVWKNSEFGAFLIDILVSLALTTILPFVLAFPIVEKLGVEFGMPRTPSQAPIARLWALRHRL